MMSEQYNTLKFYNDNAKEYFEQTIIGDLELNYKTFLNHLSENAYILDFGCGSGRDSKYFIEKGYKVRAIDGSYKMCEIASKYINQKVDCIEFKNFKEDNVYDAIWACATILHIEEENLPDILTRMINALKNEGIIYFSFKKGHGTEIVDGRFFNYMTKDKFDSILSNVGLDYEIKEYFESISSTKRPEKCTWINFVIKFNKN